MSGSGLAAIQKAVYAKLIADATLMGFVTGVFDYVPDKQAYPYVTIGDATEIPFRTFGKGGHEQTLKIHAWSQAKGFKQAEDIVSQISTVLEAALPVVEGHATVLCNYEGADTMREADGITRRVIARYRIIVQDNS